MKIEPFVKKYNWEGIDFPLEQYGKKKKKLTKAIEQLLLMFCMLKKKKNTPPYVSKRNSNREKQSVLLMIPNGQKSHYLAVKKLSALLKE